MEQGSTEFFFDISEGSLIVGKMALEHCIESGVNPGDIKPLSELLAQPNRLIAEGDYPDFPRKQWDPSDNVSYIRWLNQLTTSSSTPKPIDEEAVKRAGYMGLGPRHGYFRRNFGLQNLYQAAEIDGIGIAGLFDSWSTEDFVNYISKHARKLGNKPSSEYLIEVSGSFNNPSPRQMIRRFGSMTELFELAGYPDIESWTRQDFIDWGIKFMIANEGKFPSSMDMSKLSAENRGPSFKTIYNRKDFINLRDFQTNVILAYEDEMAYQEQRHKQLLNEVDDTARTDPKLKDFIFSQPDEDSTLVAIAKHKLATALLPIPSPADLISVCATANSKNFVAALLRRNKHLSIGDIEATAMQMGVFDYLWPMDDYKTQLRVID